MTSIVFEHYYQGFYMFWKSANIANSQEYQKTTERYLTKDLFLFSIEISSHTHTVREKERNRNPYAKTRFSRSLTSINIIPIDANLMGCNPQMMHHVHFVCFTVIYEPKIYSCVWFFFR